MIIVGAGPAGALVALTLAEAGRDVLLLESGPRIDRAAAVRRFLLSERTSPDAPYEDLPHAPRPVQDDPHRHYVQRGPELYNALYERAVGGSTWHWLGNTPRLLRADLEMKRRYGLGVDWPIGYDDLEPWYVRAEAELGVSGDEPTGPDRSAPLPLPALPMTYLDRQVAEAASKLDLHVRVGPQARAAEPWRGRAACCGSASCVPICPVGARYTATLHVDRAEAAGARLVTGAVVSRIVLGPRDEVAELQGRHADGSPFVARGRRFVLAANAVETPRLLLASADGRWSGGLANQSGKVGRGLMDHLFVNALALTHEPVFPYRGPLVTSCLDDLRDTPARRDRAAFRVEIFNSGWWGSDRYPTAFAEQMLAEGRPVEEIERRLAQLCSRHLRLGAIVEVPPDEENRIEADASALDAHGNPRPAVSFRVPEYTRRGAAEAEALLARLIAAIGAEPLRNTLPLQSVHHPSGTCRMGRDPRESVVDPDLRAHDHPNLSVIGSAVFPTVGTSNPTLTIAALALRLGQRLAQER